MMSTTSCLIRFPQSMSALAALSMVIVTDPLIIASPAATGRTFLCVARRKRYEPRHGKLPLANHRQSCPHSGGRKDGHRHGRDMRLSLKSYSWWH
jgi:hypothetical protein